ncbi:MAG: hypothetical protein J4G09_09975 [Proteobacteria bacterium]|nr:hypothetical protein [Pseudomonadota bacterium]
MCPLSVLCAFLAAWPCLAQTSDFEYRDEPMLEDRRPLPRSAWEYHGHSFPHILDVAKDYYIRVGISSLLTDAQIDYYRRKGTNPFVLYDIITEFGITPGENQRLEGAGVTFVLRDLADLDSWHYVALADAIVEGVVTKLDAYPRGIYRTRVVLDVDRVYKDCGTVPALRGVFRLLGPRQHGEQVNHWVSQPDFRLGEKVLILAGRHPMQLRRLVGSALHTESLDALRDDFGPPQRLIEAASRPLSNVLEIYQAFKVVRGNFVIKSGPLDLKIGKHTDVMEREYFGDRAAAIVDAQGRECHTRTPWVGEE